MKLKPFRPKENVVFEGAHRDMNVAHEEFKRKFGKASEETVMKAPTFTGKVMEESKQKGMGLTHRWMQMGQLESERSRSTTWRSSPSRMALCMTSGDHRVSELQEKGDHLLALMMILMR